MEKLKRKVCGAILHYENMCGMRTPHEVRGKTRYNFECPDCRLRSFNDGKTLNCIEQVSPWITGAIELEKVWERAAQTGLVQKFDVERPTSHKIKKNLDHASTKLRRYDNPNSVVGKNLDQAVVLISKIMAQFTRLSQIRSVKYSHQREVLKQVLEDLQEILDWIQKDHQKTFDVLLNWIGKKTYSFRLRLKQSEVKRLQIIDHKFQGFGDKLTDSEMEVWKYVASCISEKSDPDIPLPHLAGNWETFRLDPAKPFTMRNGVIILTGKFPT